MGMENKLKFTKTGPESGDYTAPYDVEWNADGIRSVSAFVAAVLLEKRDEWGSIYLIEDERGWMHAPFVEYKYGSVVRVSDSFRGWDDDREIVSITARGGGTNMDYYVRFKASEEGTNEPAADERRDNDEATKEQQRREAMERNVAESIRCVAEHVIASADNYAKAVDDFSQRMSITMEFNVNELPRVTFTQDAVPRTWVNAVKDGRCHVWTNGGTKEDPANEG